MRRLYDYHFSKEATTTLNEAEMKLKSICKDIRDFSNQIGDEGELLNIDTNNKEEVFRKSTILHSMRDLENAYREVSQSTREVVNEGYLSKNMDGRYTFMNGDYLTSGSLVEVLSYDDWEEKEVWFRGSIEHHDDYYHTGLGKEVSLEGKYARQKR